MSLQLTRLYEIASLLNGGTVSFQLPPEEFIRLQDEVRNFLCNTNISFRKIIPTSDRPYIQLVIAMTEFTITQAP